MVLEQGFLPALAPTMISSQHGHLAAVPAAGTPQQRVHGLREVADASAEPILLDPLLHLAEHTEHLAAMVVPHPTVGQQQCSELVAASGPGTGRTQ
ncbi:hypothetical protein AB8O64_02805 [Streptomyces sp. QH1-20]|uniref:hypothetical protein n=1 Tax=Streptomyces sp. QH1-20 TaxID=3240934 RepID=UPI0035188A84